MENLLFIKIEIVIFILSLMYIFYYLWSKIYTLFFKVKNIVKPTTIKKRKTALNKVNLNNKNTKVNYKKEKDFNLSETNKQKVIELVQKVKTNATKWYFDTSKSLIVEWLSLDKYNRDLNLQLAFIYEKENKYTNAEYIYKDLLDNYQWDYEIMKNLWYILAIQNKLTESLLIYELLHTKKKWDIEVMEILADLSFTLESYKKALKFSMLFLWSKPRDIDKLSMKAICLDKLWRLEDSIEVYKRILELQPYNTKAKDNLLLMQEKKDHSDKLKDIKDKNESIKK